MSLRAKLALIATALTFVGLGLGLLITYWSLLNLQLAEIDGESRLLAGVVLEAAILRPEGTVRVPSVVESYLTDEGGLSSAQVYLDGQLLWEGGVLDAPRPLDPEGLLGGQGGRSVSEWRVYTLADPDAGITVQVGRPLVGMREVLRPYNAIALPLTLGLSLLSGVIAWFPIGAALRPLSRLADAASRFEEGADIPPVAGNDEPAKLARSFAALLARLRSERQREQQFLAYAAHELRTPLSALRAGLESARMQKLPAGPDLLKRLHREAARLETLAQNLLALSRAEMGELRAEQIELDTLAAAAYDRFQPLALERGLELRLEQTPAPALGDTRLLGQALDNLVANALRCTPSGEVLIRSGHEDDRAFLEVADSGPGLPEPLHEGLGLRVVRTVAQAHGGALQLSSERGTRARLWLASGRR